MISKSHFIKATEEYNTFEHNVPAYYFRRKYVSEEEATAKITIAVCGFYEIFFNGTKITKGFLSPYISNPDHYIYYDEYDVKLNKGENVIGILLGNGLQNNPGGHIWEFDKADFRSAPMFALSLTDGVKTLLCSDESFKIAPSPIRRDDYRLGEYYDANFEIDGWNTIGYDDSTWENAISAIAPKGELRLANVRTIVKECEIAPVEIIKCEDGYIYDFGISNAGVCRLSVCGTKGQKIDLIHVDSFIDGHPNLRQIWFRRDKWERDREIVHRDIYICKGEGNEVYEPTFTYHGFRYVKVLGITEEQATKGLLTYLVYHTHLNSRGDFSSSDTVSTTLQEFTRRSIISNFHHYPTDCPQREKNGWTADAALSCEAALLNYDPEINYREWMRNVRKTQREDGALPGIVPTGGWGYQWGNGPAWDCVLVYLPYFTYIYRGSTEMITESKAEFVKYLKYLRSRVDDKGLLSIGLGDWCHVGREDPSASKAPLIVTDSIMALDISTKMAFLLDIIGAKTDADFARCESEKYRSAIRRELINKDNLRVLGDCQSSQAMALFYGVFEENEKQAAFDELLKMIHDEDDHIDVGVLGGRVIFHVLSQFGCSDLAYKMITREDYPSYGNWIKRGATTLWENFLPNKVYSMNHHFWGDISAWFIKRIAGIQLNPNQNNVNEVRINPSFISVLEHASAYHIAPNGKIEVSWKRDGDSIVLTLNIPSGVSAEAVLESPFCFEGGESTKSVTSGVYKIIRS